MDDSLTLLVDAPSLIYRALFSTPDTVLAQDGRPMNAAHGFFRMLAKLVRDSDADYVACAADRDWRPRWRVDLIPSYKAHRAEPGSQQEAAEERLAHQMPVIAELLELCGVQLVGYEGYEAEDIIGTLAQRAPGRVAIVSGDRDLFQLVEDPRCFVVYPVRGVSQVQFVNEAYIQEKYGIPGRAYRDFAVLRGDSSDGLPGVRGIGEKSATALIAKHGSLEKVTHAAQQPGAGAALLKVRRDLDYIDRAVKVVTIARDIPLPEVDLSRPDTVRQDAAIAAAAELGLSNPVKELIDAVVRSD